MGKKPKRIKKKFEDCFTGSEVSIVMWDDECDGIQEAADEIFKSMSGKFTTEQMKAIVSILSSSVLNQEFYNPVTYVNK